MRSERDTTTLVGQTSNRFKKYLLKKCLPSLQSDALYAECVNDTLEMLNSCKYKPANICFEHLGSGARQTRLPRHRQMDIFVGGSIDTVFNFLQKFATEHYYNCEKIKKSQGISYVRCKKKWRGCVFTVQLIPYDNLNAVPNTHVRDRTYLANSYVKAHLTPELRLQVLKAKYLLKRIGLYDSSSYTQGFAGYAVECIVLKYGSINNLPEDTYFLQDPVYPGRNILASICYNNLKRFFRLRKTNYKIPKTKIATEVYKTALNLKVYTALTKNVNVLCAVKRGAYIYCQVKNHEITTPDQHFNLKLRADRITYYSMQSIKKIISPEDVIKNYGLEKTVLKQDIRIYNFFK